MTVTGYLSSHGIVVSGSGEGAAQLADLSSGFVNGNNIAGRKQIDSSAETVIQIYIYIIIYLKISYPNIFLINEQEVNLPRLNFLFTETVNHLVAQVIYCLHLSSL